MYLLIKLLLKVAQKYEFLSYTESGCTRIHVLCILRISYWRTCKFSEDSSSSTKISLSVCPVMYGPTICSNEDKQLKNFVSHWQIFVAEHSHSFRFICLAWQVMTSPTERLNTISRPDPSLLEIYSASAQILDLLVDSCSCFVPNLIRTRTGVCCPIQNPKPNASILQT